MASLVLTLKALVSAMCFVVAMSQQCEVKLLAYYTY